MLLWDGNNGIARRSWARNEGAMNAIKREMERTPGLKVTLPNIADDEMIKSVLQPKGLLKQVIQKATDAIRKAKEND
jgi:hypothetical protein